jgi:hypothetical protein
MNDNELLTAVRHSFDDLHSATPVERIVLRSQTMRARHRVPALAAAAVATAVVAGAVALAVTTLVPGGHQVGRPAGIQLAAWTVVKQPGGTIVITIRELRDPAGLQSRLRADGVPASVTFRGGVPRACQGYGADVSLINKVFTESHHGRFPVMVIHPAALPHGAGLQINPSGTRQISTVEIGLVRASSQCTGS